ncbi:hypothetical protein GBAR_LOCUS17158 [Geodia barretti]|uniref:Uncharacterized protein n=1 Tax=Geodia barretti TaxID=519541 RepID=A0AA35WXI8_GEOBA|nr:hypothetical protein GBAR_LOCUS17158 [Geodia barretti]
MLIVSDTLMRVHDATYGRLQLNHTSRPHAIWRLICARDPETRERGTPSIVLMKMNTTIGDYIQIKSKRLQGCSYTYRGFVFKRSMTTLATSLFNRRPMEHIQNEDMFDRVAGLLREGEEGLLTIGATDPELRRVIDLASVSPRREQSGSGGNSAADYD